MTCLGLLLLFAAPLAASIEGVVKDTQGRPVPGATVTIRTAAGGSTHALVTDERGSFRLDEPLSGTATASTKGGVLESAETALPEDGRLELIVQPRPSFTQVTVTATRGAAEDARDATQVVTSLDQRSFELNPLPTIGNALEGAPGILVQQTSTSQVSPFLRGLTGYQVLNLIDGVRFSNSTFRSGPNQYLAFVDPSQAQRMEAVLGPAGAAYGSDAMGGAIHVVTPGAQFATQGPEVHGQLRGNGATADRFGGGSGEIQISGEKIAWLVGGAGRRHGDLRSGRGTDSRHVLTRFFGLDDSQIRTVTGSRLRDTGFEQMALHSKLALRLAACQSLTLWYQRGEQYDTAVYKDLDGGLGRQLSFVVPQRLQFAYARYEKLKLGPFDSLSGAVSVNSQADGSRRRGLRDTDRITTDASRVDSWGYQGQVARNLARSHSLVAGGELYRESILATRVDFDPRTTQTLALRPLYPNGSVYRTGALFVQDTAEWFTGRLRTTVGTRATFVNYATSAAKNVVGGRNLGVADSSQSFRDATFQSSAAWRLQKQTTVFAIAGRGFRGPNVNDLGAVGLNDLGYEIPAASASGALLSTSAGEDALSQGKTLDNLKPERLWNFEVGIKQHISNFYLRAQAFRAELYDPIVRRTLLFPAGSVPAQLGSLPVTAIPATAAQRAQGVVTVATAIDPRAVKAFVNDGRAVYQGIEGLGEWRIDSHWSLRASYSFIVGRELNPNRNTRRLPPQQGYAAVRRSAGRFYWEASVLAAGAQSRLNGGDRDDERIGASRRRRDIADFFAGSRIAPWIGGGPDGTLGTTDDRFLPTGETLRQIQDRVLPVGATVQGVLITDDNSRAPLYSDTAGFARVDVQGGFSLRENVDLQLGVLNLLDRNYRVHGSGIDGPGVSLYLGAVWRF